MKQQKPDSSYVLTTKGHMAMVEEYDPSRMVLRSLEPDAKLTPEQIAMLEEAKKSPIEYEEDCPELTPDMIEAFKRAALERDQRRKVG